MEGGAASPGPASPAVELSQFECSVCLNLLYDPIVGNCGHDFCRSCLDKWRMSERQRGRAVRCPVCRGVFADTSFDKLGVCVRLRETIAALFPERSAARRREVERQQAMEKTRTAAAVEAESSRDSQPARQQPLPLPLQQGDGSPNPFRRRVHVLRRRSGSAGNSSSNGNGAGGARGSHSTPLFISAGGQFPASMVAAAAGSPAGAGLWGVLQQQLQGAAAAASQGAGGSNGGAGSSGGSGGNAAGREAWPGEGLVHVDFCMGWHAAVPRNKRGRARRLR